MQAVREDLGYPSCLLGISRTMVLEIVISDQARQVGTEARDVTKRTP